MLYFAIEETRILNMGSQTIEMSVISHRTVVVNEASMEN